MLKGLFNVSELTEEHAVHQQGDSLQKSQTQDMHSRNNDHRGFGSSIEASNRPLHRLFVLTS